uniref:Granulocyte-macrophage colony-stimulating factor receptor subunit alpha-like n=1 Tax=Sphenodon punctatus TaxID=8508 RepID=A0A8D0GE05_SPHPU
MKEENMAAVSGLASRFWFIVFVSSYVVSQQAASETLANLPSPLVNLTVNLKKLEMTWDNTANVTTYICCMSSVGVDQYNICTRGEKSCSFMNSLVKPIHQGALFEVKTEYNNKPFSEKYLFTPEGMNGTSAENFSCTVYNVSSMKCTWKAGWNASQDTQYFLYIKYWGEDNERECHNYIKNTLGRHVGCNFHNVTIAERKVYFLVNGSSNETVIRFYDEYINLYEIGKRVHLHFPGFQCENKIHLENQSTWELLFGI